MKKKNGNSNNVLVAIGLVIVIIAIFVVLHSLKEKRGSNLPANSYEITAMR